MKLGQIDNQHKDKSYFKLLPSADIDVNDEMINLFFKTMFERQEVWYNKTCLGLPRDKWTDNKIFAEYRFTNVYRELDRSSQWLIKNVLCDSDNSVEDLLFKIIIYRFINKPDCFEHKNKYLRVELQSYEDFDEQEMWRQMAAYRKHVENPWQIAYMTNLAFLAMPDDWDNERDGMFKDHAYIRYIFPKVHKLIPKLKKTIQTSNNVEDTIKLLETIPAVSSFMSHEFFMDFCYVAKYGEKPLWKFETSDWVNNGPGSSLGIRLLFPSLQTIKEQSQAFEWLLEIAESELSRYGNFKYVDWNRDEKKYEIVKKINLTKNIIEFWLCEFSKYNKILWKEGKQRSKYSPHK